MRHEGAVHPAVVVLLAAEVPLVVEVPHRLLVVVAQPQVSYK